MKKTNNALAHTNIIPFSQDDAAKTRRVCKQKEAASLALRNVARDLRFLAVQLDPKAESGEVQLSATDLFEQACVLSMRCDEAADAADDSDT
jgi:hypothetical protein